MRVLITGAAGFAGRHLAEQLRDAGHELTGLGRSPAAEFAGDWIHADLSDPTAAREAVQRARPEWIFHLAASASVEQSWREPAATMRNNVDATLNVLEAAAGAKVLVAGSGEVYGPPAQLPVDETHELRPQNPYAVSKATTDLLAGFYADAHGLHVIRTRSFNHFGPGQSDAYVVAAFARQIAAAERAGEQEVVVGTGELGARRDFTDVRDVVRAYISLLEMAEPGAYNVCSGNSRSAEDVLTALAAQSPLAVRSEVDPGRLRRHEVMDIRGSHAKLTDATGWEPSIPFGQTIADTLDWWRAQ